MPSALMLLIVAKNLSVSRPMGGEPVKLPFLEHVALWALPRFENPGTLQCVPLTICAKRVR